MEAIVKQWRRITKITDENVVVTKDKMMFDIVNCHYKQHIATDDIAKNLKYYPISSLLSF